MMKGTDACMTTRLTGWLTLLVFACGPRPVDDRDDDAAGAAGPADDCEDAECSSDQSCGPDQRSCYGALGMGDCIAGKCSPVPMDCVVESEPEDSCAEVCAAVGEGVICVENGCEGATAFGYPGPGHLAVDFCGQSNSTVQDAVIPIEMPCNAPLVFTGEGSFEVYQCCCDHPGF
jgi:hypothetical protein